MELDVVSNVVLQWLRIYNDVDFVLNGINLEFLKCRSKKQLVEFWNWILRSNVGNKLMDFSLAINNNFDRLTICSKCEACQTSFNDEPHFICEIQTENYVVVEEPEKNVWVDKKISRLESQVQDLTKQVANLRIQLSQASRMQTSCAIPSLIVTNSGPPPPPPMPTFSYVDPIANIKTQINKNKSRNSLGIDGGPTQTSTPLLTLADVMKGAKNIKLKKIARSPGGTPIRPPKSIETGTDLSAILARHLKRRHDLLNPCESPHNNSDSGSENSFQLSSPECSVCLKIAGTEKTEESLRF